MKKTILLPAAMLCFVACASSEPTIRGLWKATLKPDSGATIPINIFLDKNAAQAFDGEVTIIEDEITVLFPDGGKFIGKISSPDQPIDGRYIQPQNQVGGQQLGHAVTLKPSADGEWKGIAQPLAREFSIYMNITEAKNGALKAVLLNPERNITGPVKQYYLVGDETQDTFALAIPKDMSEVTKVAFDRANNFLKMDFGPMQGLELESVDPKDNVAKGYHGEANRNTLSRPSPNGTWPTGTINGAGFDAAKLSRLVQGLAAVSGDEGQPSLIHSLLVARGGELILEEYFRNHTENMPHDIRSAGKTFASILVGVLIEEGQDLSGDTPLNRFISVPNESADTPIKLSHLLTHQSGLNCCDGDNSSPGGENNMWQQSDEEDFWTFTAELDFVAPPGTQYAYCSGGINLVGAALAGASGDSVFSLLQKRIFVPLGFENAYWNVMPNGEAYLGGGGHLRTRDLLKIGQLYLDDGKWLGQQIIDKAWVQESITPKVQITPETTGLDKSAFERFYFGGTDGYAWHLQTIEVDDKTYDTYEASGNGGQMVVIVPELDLVVGMTGGNYMEGFVWGKWRQQIIGDGIIAALK